MRTPPATTLLLCRGCCCGTGPGFDHEAQREALEGVASPVLEVQVVDCLDECDRRNVAVVRRPGLPKDRRDTWLGGLTRPAATAALRDWLQAGAEGPLPAPLAGRAFRHVPPRRRR